jgi:hypothetical protein
LVAVVLAEEARASSAVQVKLQVSQQEVVFLAKAHILLQQLNQIPRLADFLEDRQPRAHRQQHKARVACLAPLKSNLHCLATQIRRSQHSQPSTPAAVFSEELPPTTSQQPSQMSCLFSISRRQQAQLPNQLERVSSAEELLLHQLEEPALDCLEVFLKPPSSHSKHKGCLVHQHCHHKHLLLEALVLRLKIRQIFSSSQ